ncbi:hypothetical protein [Amycolatopsis sp. NPDC004079]|uniref:hypothetical protein n=1 Tax=Amycolatopsis sp. NPDC004079 TaxID=3154549 RepID=UPI0033B35926
MHQQGFRRNDGGGYVSRNDPIAWDRSSFYVVAAAAQRLLEQGRELALPAGYDGEALDRVVFATGWNDRDVVVDERQGREMAAIAKMLMERHGDVLRPEEKRAAEVVREVVRLS